MQTYSGTSKELVSDDIWRYDDSIQIIYGNDEVGDDQSIMIMWMVQVCGPMEVSGVLAVQELAQDLVVKWGEANVHRQILMHL